MPVSLLMSTLPFGRIRDSVSPLSKCPSTTFQTFIAVSVSIARTIPVHTPVISAYSSPIPLLAPMHFQSVIDLETTLHYLAAAVFAGFHPLKLHDGVLRVAGDRHVHVFHPQVRFFP